MGGGGDGGLKGEGRGGCVWEPGDYKRDQLSFT